MTPVTTTQLAVLVGEIADLFRSINRVAQPELLAALDDVDVSISQVKALFALDRAGPLSGTALARELELSPAATSRAADGLVLAGLAARLEVAGDRRVRLLEITPAGRQLVTRIVTVRTEAIEQIVSLLDEAEQLRLLQAIAPLADRAGTRTGAGA